MKGGFVVGCKKYKQITGKLKEQLKKAYLTTDVTYEKLADEYGVSANSLTSLGAKEKWYEQRQEVYRKYTEKYIELLSQELLKEHSDVVKVTHEGFAKAAEKAKEIIESSDSIYEINKAVKTLETIADKIGIKAPIDLKMQEAQIKKIEAETELAKSKVNGDTTDDGGITLIISR